MVNRIAVYLVALLLFAGCTSKSSSEEPSKVDSSSQAKTTSVDVGRSSAPPPSHSHAGPRGRPNVQRRNAADRMRVNLGGTVDPRILDCVKKSADGAAQRACFQRLSAPSAPVKPGQFGADRPPLVDPIWSVTDWYVCSSTGSNNNNGTTSGSPLHDAGEVFSRWGTTEPVISVGVTIHALCDWPSNGDWIRLRPTIIQGGSLAIVGSTTTLCSGTLSSVVPKTYAQGTADGRLHANLGGCASGNQGMLIVNSTRASSVGEIDQCSGSVCALSQPLDENVPNFNTGFPPSAEHDNWANGDSFTVLRPTKVNISSLMPMVVGNNASTFPAGGYVGHVWIPNYDTGDAGATTTFVHNAAVSIIESRIDAFPEMRESFVNDNEAVLSNTWVSNGAIETNGFVRGGSFAALATLYSVSISGGVTDDVIFHTLTAFGQRASDVSVIGPIYSDGELEFFNDVDLLGDVGPPIIYGTYVMQGGLITPTQTTLSFVAPASTAFGGVPTWNFCGNAALANAFDRSVTPGAWYTGRTLSTAALDAVIGGPTGTGFGGIAYCDNGSTVAALNAQQTTPPVAYVAPVGNGGTGLDAGCPDGSTYEGTGPGTAARCVYVTGLPPTGAAGGDLAGTFPNPSVVGIETKALPALPGSDQFLHYTGSGWSFSPLVTGVSSVTGAGTVNCSPTSGAVTCTGTAAVSSVSGTSGVSCSPTSGAVSCSVSSVTTGQITHGTPNQVMTTNSAGNASQWSTISTDLAPLGNGSFETVGLLSLALSVSGAQLQTGNVLTYTGAQAGCSNTGGSCFFAFQKPQPPGSSNSSFGGNSLTVGPTNTVLASTTLNAPSGAGVLIVANFNFRNNLDFVTRGGSGEDVIYGIGDSGTGGNFYSGASATLSVPPDSTADVIGGFAGHQSGHAASPMVWRTTGTGGTVTYQALANAVFYSGMTGNAWIFAQQVP